MDNEAKRRWRAKDLWTEHELVDLCCGREPDATRNNDQQRNDAAEAVKRAMMADALTPIQRPGAGTAERMYATANLFRPAVAIRWASAQFEAFPWKVANDLDPRERKSLLRIIAALANGCSIDLKDHAIAERIAEMTDSLGASVSADVIRKYLKGMPDALDQ